MARHGPGEEAEVDFGEATVILAGEPIGEVLHALPPAPLPLGQGVTLAFLAQDQTAFLEGHALRLRAPRWGARPDPLRQPTRRGERCCRVVTGSRPTASSRCAATTASTRSSASPGVRGAHEKGGVEGEVGRFRRRHLVPVPAVATMAEFDELLARPTADETRRITGRGARPWARPSRRAALPAASARRALRRARAPRARVDRKARICVRQRWYSVPAGLRGRDLDVRLGGPPTVEVHQRRRLVARHERSPGRAARPCPRPLPRGARAQARRPARLPDARPGAGLAAPSRRPTSASGSEPDGSSAMPAGTRALIEVLLLHRTVVLRGRPCRARCGRAVGSV